MLISAVVISAATIHNTPAHALSPLDIDSDKLLSVTFIDLGTKGESTLIVLPNESVILMDGGMPSAYNNIKDVLNSFGITTIHLLVATHADQDHVAGLNKLLESSEFNVNQVMISPVTKDTKTYQRFLQYTTDNRIIGYAGDKITLDENVSIKILSPPSEYRLAKDTNAGLENTNSIITLLEYGNVEFLFTSDATYVTENWLINNVPKDELDIDIMSAPHHGSKHSSTAGFISATSPEIVVYSANVGNQYGHPHLDATNRYESRGILGLHTGLRGDVLIQTDGIGCSLLLYAVSEMPCFDGIVMVSESVASTPNVIANKPISDTTGADANIQNDYEKDELLQYVSNIRSLLNDAKIAYVDNSDANAALRYVKIAYNDNYNFLTNPLADAGEYKLMQEVKVMLNTELVEMITSGASKQSVSDQIDTILIKMDAVEAVVPEFGALVVVFVSALVVIVIVMRIFYNSHKIPLYQK